MKPFIFLNFKAYPEATGKHAEKLASIASKIKAQVFLCVQAVDLRLLAKSKPVFAQHADSKDVGALTGSVTLQVVKNAGAKGVMLNHSEKRVGIGKLLELVPAAKQLHLKTLVCVKDLEEARDVLRLGPDFIAFEVPELIGSGKAITSVHPDSVMEFARMFEGLKSIPLCGAGITNVDDVKTALRLGCKGVLVASAFVKRPKEFVQGFRALHESLRK